MFLTLSHPLVNIGVNAVDGVESPIMLSLLTPERTLSLVSMTYPEALALAHSLRVACGAAEEKAA